MAQPQLQVSGGREDPRTDPLAALQSALVRRARQLAGGRTVGVGALRAEDLAQTVVVRLLNTYGADTLRGWSSGRLYGYAYRSLHNLVVDEHRKKRERFFATGEAAREPGEAPAAERGLVAAERQARVRRCLEELEAQPRSFLERSFQLDSAPKAQAEVGWPPGSAANACHRRKKLLALLNRCVHRRET